MAETKFTKGAWLVDPIAKMTVVSENGRGITSISYSQNYDFDKVYAENKANAHLIAAAPELYDALVDARKQLEECTQEFMGEDYNDPVINAVLAKARGE